MRFSRSLHLSVIVATASLVACEEAEGPTEDVLTNFETKLSPRAQAPTGVCPDTSLGATRTPAYYQHKATQAFHYVLGGADPFAAHELASNPECSAARACITLLRDNLESEGVTLQPAFADTVCGLSAAIYRVDLDASIPDALRASLASCGTHLDGCWGVGVSGFYYADPDADSRGRSGSKGRIRHLYIDPEPARLTSDLVGPTGYTAPAIFTISLEPTTVLKWPGSYVSSATPPAAGTPCSTTDLLAGVETLKVLQGIGSIRRCY